MTGLRTSQQWARVSVSRQRVARSLRLPLLASSLLIGGCASIPMFGSGPPPPPPPSPVGEPVVQPGVASDAQNAPRPAAAPVVHSGPKVGILLPLSGPNGSLGATMLRAAKLALAASGTPMLDAYDTSGPGGAGQAATLAIQSGDRILLGPLTSAETAAVAPIAQQASVPVLAFTSDVSQARPGVWVMGVTPEQQVRRLVFAAKNEGRTRIAALLPADGLGDALADGLTHACADAGLSPPTILTHAGTADSITETMKQLSDLTTRQGVVDQQVKDKAAADAAAGTPAAGQTVAGVAPAPALVPGVPPLAVPLPAIAATGGTGPLAVVAPAPVVAPPPSLPPPPFDALLLGDTGLQLQRVISALHTSGVNASQVRIMGPGLWGAFASKLRALAGAWYAAPDPSARLGFAQEYRAAYGQGLKPLADIPYDVAALARSLAPSGYGVDALTRADGFAGVDGVFALKPDGHVHRALAIFQVQPGGGGVIVQAAPRSLSDTGS